MPHIFSELRVGGSMVERTRDLKAFYAASKNFPLLSVDEELELIKKYRAGDMDARDTLVNCNLRFVIAVAKKYDFTKGATLSIVDLINEGVIGLIKAIETFDETLGFKLISHAVHSIRGEILHSINVTSRVVKCRDKNVPNDYTSLDEPLDSESDTTRGDMLETYDTDNTTNESLIADLTRCMDKLLKPAEIEIVCEFYGFGTTQMLKWEIAERHGKSEERIRQICEDAITKIRSNANALALLAKYRG